MITSELLAKLFPDTRRAERDRFIAALNRFCPLYGITTRLRVAAFVATGGVETDYLRTTVEYASGRAYEGRSDLGNVQKGDGVRFKGRGFFQTTGRTNYGAVTRATRSKLGIDFEIEPGRLAEIDIAVESACIFWRDNDLSRYADRGDFFAVSGVVNRGSAKKQALGWTKRRALYELCLKVIAADFSFEKIPSANDAKPTAPAADQDPQPSTGSAEPVVLTPPSAGGDFLSNAFDKTVSADAVKSFARDNVPTVLKPFARALVWIGAALEAGNVYVWLGVAAAALFIAVEIYLHRAALLNLWQKLKAKLTA